MMPSAVQAGDFSWSSTAPGSALNFIPCYQDYLCARLEVPLDWSASAIENKTAALAVIKLPAQVDPADERYGGSIIVNPGGPGGSGVQEILNRGKEIQRTVDSPDDAQQSRYFDIVSFDPRGVGNTIPPLTCFPDLLSSYLWNEAVQAHGLVGSSEHAADLLWARMQALATSYAKLQYWGYSYGTLLGVTYASLFPNQVQRMVLDGVVDALSWYSGEMSTSLRDADRVFDSFFRYCHQAGQPRCAFASPSADGEDNINAISELQQRFTNILSDLKASPLWTTHPNPDIITYSDVRRLLRLALYAPIDLFPTLAIILADLEQRNATSMAEWKTMLREEMQPAHCLSSECQSDAPCREACQYSYRVEVTAGTVCLDLNQKLLNATREEYWDEYLRPSIESSHWMGDTFADFLMPCARWNGRGPGDFKGPTGAQDMSTPVLFVSNTLDPVTPLGDAHAMSALFEKSVVLEQHAEGHCSFASRSGCTDDHIRAYFQTGELPAPGTRCETDIRPFGVEDVLDGTSPVELERTEL
ncbi:hypothetical protein M747DRAFT_323680 [Aspergillus niger ATCC 13496]|uniref:Uncharacterized protein n=1 Tax=Aspergillus niger ATCC 13496 TaxID=1353008 RepID=A0A370BVF4_ASPNG|nr:hypothetical protein M747DRAFT_323680 [Aspergillus niger ATCC 13496]